MCCGWMTIPSCQRGKNRVVMPDSQAKQIH
jgi:hypothetical protein